MPGLRCCTGFSLVLRAATLVVVCGLPIAGPPRGGAQAQ